MKQQLQAAILAAIATAATGTMAVAAPVDASPTTWPATSPAPDPSELTLQARPGRDLTALSLEDLMDIQVTSVSKKSQRIADAPAAIHVITSDDIAHSGLTSIPELLRLSPGLEVARVSANGWAVSSRGFNSLYANKLLVLMDGRTLYTPIFSGTLWSDQDYILQDLERIEVVRGPGATLWGANAVNGVINITTRDARDTQGWLLDGLGGNAEQQGAVRYGAQIDDHTYYRVYAKYRNNLEFDIPGGGGGAGDDWDSVRGGFRIDRHASDDDTFTLQGDVYRNRIDMSQTVPSSTPPFFVDASGTFNNEGQNILARWTHANGDDSSYSLQVYYDRLVGAQAIGRVDQHTFDLDFQHRFRVGARQEFIWGVGGRFITSSIDETDLFHVSGGRREDFLLNAFVQDAIMLAPERLTLFLGSKFEYGSIAGLEVQPSARLLWTPNDRNSVWGAVSRAARTPSQVDVDSRISVQRGVLPNGVPFTTDLVGAAGVESEELTAYELGYRVKASPALSFDVATFFNDYGNLRTNEPGTPFPDPESPGRLLIPLFSGTEGEGESYGVELASTWQVNDDWRLTASYTFLVLNLHNSASSGDPTFEDAEGVDPRNQVQIHSRYKVTRHVTFDAALYYVDSLPAINVDSYVRADLGLTWRPDDNFQLSGWVQNLFDSGHTEFGSQTLTTPSEIPLTLYVQATWRF